LLIDLNGLVLRDLLRRHPLVIHVPSLVQQSASFARWTSLRGRRVSLSDETLRNRISDPRYGLTGREQSLDDMLRAFGMQDG
jgi:hypothetical protein